MNEPSQRSQALLGRLDPGAARGVEALLHAATARIRRQLVNRVGADLELRHVATDWLPLAYALGRDTAPAAWVTFRLDPSGLAGVVSIQAQLLGALVGQILGEPVTRRGDRALRAPSRFDVGMAVRIGEDVISSIAGMFPAECGATPVMGAGGSSARVAIALSRTAIVGAATWQVGPEDAPIGQLTVVLPSEVTRIVTPRIARRPSESRLGMERVMGFPVVAVAELHRLTLSLSQVRALVPGQLIDLGPVRDIVVRVGDRPTLTGDAGAQNHFRSVRVKNRIDGGTSR